MRHSSASGASPAMRLALLEGGAGAGRVAGLEPRQPELQLRVGRLGAVAGVGLELRHGLLGRFPSVTSSRPSSRRPWQYLGAMRTQVRSSVSPSSLRPIW